ncbi:GGDEF domain-containing protein [Deinococcus marmoris]|uniref:Diguanylate cyclase/phosphodiesterase (GGDEF & EAL domains) with PAS/PAC sensor(S) n=1 Tax=Deinococcus marmoris TaxID=249408 RepID=A0A1U7P3I0_9DEIO|nr:sensor domain-containing diguanylate cyclase [Deinococcus marmoris]OLV19731.1 diguanylate cyclase/phosphodiesterase (GGDEF & EAL domains) with PAS/PAC sensor(s) [Deinococcus marmoris]
MPRFETTPLVRYHQLVQVLASLARSSHEVEAVVQAVHQQAGTLFLGHITLLALRQPGGDWRWELYREEKRYTHRLPFYPRGLIESVLHSGPLSVPDLPAYLDEHPVRIRRVVDDRVVLERGEDDAPDRLALSMLFVPLEVRGERTGVLSIQSYETHAFDDTDLEFLQLLAQHVSIALENAALREELEQLTRTDMLTGLPNRRAFYYDVPLALDTARQEGRELHLVMLDVHEFKRINDSFGHQTGDEVLARVGQALRQTFPAPDAAFRLGGDEFALLVWEPEARLEALALRLTHALRAAEWPPGPGPICLQGGVAKPPPDGNIDDWLSLADARMYHAKRRRIVGNQVDWGMDFGDVGHIRPPSSGTDSD